MEGEPFQVGILDFFDVFAVLLREDNVAYAGSFGRQNLLLDTAHGQHFAPQGNLARHGQVVFHLALREGRGQRGDHSDTGRGAVFGNGTFGYVDVHGPLVEHIFVDAQQRSVRLDVLQGNDSRLLHHVAQVAGEGEFLALRFAQARLDEEYFAAYRRPGQPGYDTGVVVVLVFVAVVLLSPQILVQVVECEGVVVLLARGLHAGDFPHDAGYLLVELAHARLAGVLVDDGSHHLFGYDYVALFQPVVLELLGYQVPAADFDLLLEYVSADVDQLHTVEQGLRYGVEIVGRSDEQNLRQVVVDVDVVVVEGVVLFGVEYLEQSRSRVALKVVAYLVDFVEHEYRVGALRLDESLDNTARHGPDVGAPVTPYLGLVVQTAQRDAYILAVQCLGYGFTQRGLAHARRSVEADDGRFHVAPQLQHGQMLDDALFHLVETVVVLVELFLHVVQVEVVLRVLVPRQLEQRVEVGILHREVGRLRVQPLELAHLFLENLGRLGIPFLLFGPFAQLLYVLVLHVAAQLLLDSTYLLLQEVFPLLLVQVLAGFGLDVGLDLQQLRLLGEHLVELEEAGLHVVDTQQFLFLSSCQRDIGSQEVDEVVGIVDISNGKNQLFGLLADVFQQVEGQVFHGRYQRFKLLVVGFGHDFVE